MPINDGKYVVPAWQDGGPPAIDAAELTAIGQSIVTNQNGVAQNTQNVSTLQQQMSTANQNIASLQQFQTTATGQIANLTNNYLPKSGGTMTGPITLPGNPSGALQAVPKQYVDARGWTLTASSVLQFGAFTTSTVISNLISSGLQAGYTQVKLKIEITNLRFTMPNTSSSFPVQMQVHFDNTGVEGPSQAGDEESFFRSNYTSSISGTITASIERYYNRSGIISYTYASGNKTYSIFLSDTIKIPLNANIDAYLAFTDQTKIGVRIMGASPGTTISGGTIKLSVYAR